MLEALQALALGAPGAAIGIARQRGPGDTGTEAALELAEASAWIAAGDRAAAASLVSAVLARAPDHPAARFLRGMLALSAGDRGAARADLEAVLRLRPEYPGAQAALAQLLLPGPHYREVLAAVHRLIAPRTYLEIGVETGATLALAGTATRAVGVDPDLSQLRVKLPSSVRLVEAESDAFFAARSREELFGDLPVDLAFVDGLHWWEVALRDFARAEAWCAPGSTIVLHDCLPVTAVAARRPRETTFWVGDTWKLLECLLAERPDLTVHVVPAPPSGLVVVRGLDPGSKRLLAAEEALVARYGALTEPPPPERWAERYPLVTNDAAGLARALGARSAG